ncbi:thiamine phosphate synthase [Niallia alba]|uniref:Thiamine phosphate synthase n=1 Tax=Niallia alba TaxID=2729105 RepID=A0A7Y0K583_9BACI|nr:thiamine phosphate synthase [Niallia alba]NMO75474.1 thiamine phosphate synthase [Niallia alba]
MKIMAVTDNTHSLEKLLSILLEIHPYVDYVQIREKAKSPIEIYTLCERLLKEGVPIDKIIVNDRLDIATLLSLKNVHLPSNGLSVNSKEEAILAERSQTDYVIYGHCYSTNSKEGKPPVTLSTISEIKSELSVPLYAIGGITEERVGKLAELGADGVAIMSAIFSASDPLMAIKRIRERCETIGIKTI